MLNFEIADHPIYDGLELQWFDDVLTRYSSWLAPFVDLDRKEGDCA